MILILSENAEPLDEKAVHAEFSNCYTCGMPMIIHWSKRARTLAQLFTTFRYRYLMCLPSYLASVSRFSCFLTGRLTVDDDRTLELYQRFLRIHLSLFLVLVFEYRVTLENFYTCTASDIARNLTHD